MRRRDLRWDWERELDRTESQASWARFLWELTEVSFLLEVLVFVRKVSNEWEGSGIVSFAERMVMRVSSIWVVRSVEAYSLDQLLALACVDIRALTYEILANV